MNESQTPTNNRKSMRTFTSKITNRIQPSGRNTTETLDHEEYEDFQDFARIDQKKGRHVLHRAALKQDPDLILKLCNSAKLKHGEPYEDFYEHFINMPDAFNNTPIISCCILNNFKSQENRPKCIENLIGFRAKINVFNERTLWSPLTWCAYYGDSTSIEILLENKAIAYAPDHRGYFPLDYAGRNGKKNVVTILLNKLIQLCKNYPNIQDNETPSPEDQALNEAYSKYIISALLRNSMLYWACYIQENKNVDMITEILKFTNVYPELPLHAVRYGNAFHACCTYGNYRALLELFGAIEKTQSEIKAANNNKISNGNESKLLVLNDNEMDAYKKAFKNYVKFMNNWILEYESKVINHPKDNNKLALWEIQDYDGNTQLHVASNFQLIECVRILLDRYADIELENHKRWKCRELCQNPRIKELYQKHVFSKLSQNNDGYMHLKQNEIKKFDTESPLSTEEKNQFEKNALNNTLINGPNVIDDILIPDIGLKFKVSAKKNSKSSFNIYVDLLKDYSVYLAPGVEDNSYILMIRLSEEELEREANNQNTKLNLNQKKLFEPFRSKQRQEIANNIFKKLIDMELILNDFVDPNLFLMHIPSGIEKIKNVWLHDKKWYLPQPLPQFFQYLFEGKRIQYSEIDTIRHYFGEKLAFYFGCSSFYTSSLVVLAPFGMAISLIILATGNFYTHLLPVYVISVMLWSTIVVEKWKRKSSEIALKWGTLDMASNETLNFQIRKEFWGDECINYHTGLLTNHYDDTKRNFTTFFSIPILLCLLTGCVLVFYFTEQYKNYFEGSDIQKFIGGALNGIGISILNIIYSTFARWAVEEENHKYHLNYEKSLIFRIFAFRFLNSFIGIFYTAFLKPGGAQLDDLFYMLLPLLVIKQISASIMQVMIPWLKFKYQKRNYFRSILQRAKKQAGYVDIDENKKENKKEDQEIFEKLIFRRPVLDCKAGEISTKNWELTQVELNYLRVEFLDDVEYYADLMVQFAFITLFAAAFPLGPAIGVLCNIIDAKSRIFALLHIYERPVAEKAGGIGLWLNIWELLSIASIGTNALLLYQFNVSRTDFLFDFGDSATRVLVFVLAEHIMFFIKFFFSQIIEDKPGWVTKEEQKIIENTQPETIVPGVKNDEDPNKVQDDKDNEKTLEINREQSLKNMEMKSNQLDEEITKLRKRLDEYIKKQEYTKNLFGDIDINNGIKSMLFMTHSNIERELILDRLNDISALSGLNHLIKCLHCNITKAYFKCLTCEENLCKECFKIAHVNLNKNNQKHEVIQLKIRELKTKDSANLNESSSPLNTNYELHDIKNISQIWNKLEYYFFPTFKHADDHNQLEKIFKILYELYLTNNGIKANKINEFKKYLKIFGDPNLGKKSNLSPILIADDDDNENDNIKANIKKSENQLIDGHIAKELFNAYKKFISYPAFNIEEKLFMNRVAFALFKKKCSDTTFSDFYKMLRVLQEGPLEAKLFLLFDLIDEDDDGYISKEDIAKFLKASFLQTFHNENEIDQIVSKLFADRRSYLDKKSAFNNFLQIQKIKDIISALLQIPLNLD